MATLFYFHEGQMYMTPEQKNEILDLLMEIFDGTSASNGNSEMDTVVDYDDLMNKLESKYWLKLSTCLECLSQEFKVDLEDKEIRLTYPRYGQKKEVPPMTKEEIDRVEVNLNDSIWVEDKQYPVKVFHGRI